MDRKRRTVADMRAMKAAGKKISMLYVTTLEEAAAADAAGIDMLSIEGRFFSPDMRNAAGRCLVQVGLPYGGSGTFQGRHLATAEDYLRAAYHFTAMGGDCFYCAAALDIQKALCDNHVPVVAHVGLVPSTRTKLPTIALIRPTSDESGPKRMTMNRTRNVVRPKDPGPRS